MDSEEIHKIQKIFLRLLAEEIDGIIAKFANEKLQDYLPTLETKTFAHSIKSEMRHAQFNLHEVFNAFDELPNLIDHEAFSGLSINFYSDGLDGKENCDRQPSVMILATHSDYGDDEDGHIDGLVNEKFQEHFGYLQVVIVLNYCGLRIRSGPKVNIMKWQLSGDIIDVGSNGSLSRDIEFRENLNSVRLYLPNFAPDNTSILRSFTQNPPKYQWQVRKKATPDVSPIQEQNLLDGRELSDEQKARLARSSLVTIPITRLRTLLDEAASYCGIEIK